MKKITLAATILAAMTFATPAMSGAVLQVSKSVEVAMSASEVWEKIGKFCAIQDWHPAVAKCEITDESGAKFRILTLGDGAKIKEKHTGDDRMGYMYQITESPLPVKNYSALFDVIGDDTKATIGWSASFLAKGKPDSEAKEIITGIFDAGLKAIQEKLKK